MDIMENKKNSRPIVLAIVLVSCHRGLYIYGNIFFY